MEQLQLPLLWFMLAAYLGAFMFYAFSFWSRNIAARNLALKFAYVGLALNTATVVLRSVLIGGLPFNNGFEFGLCFVFAAAVAFVLIEKKFNVSAIGLFVMPVLVAISVWLVSLDLTVQPVMPALRSYWLAVHVSAAVIAYGSFAVSFAVAIAYLVKEQKETDLQSRVHELPALKVLDEVSYKLIFIGVPFLTIMLVTGAVWAEYAWGRFWSWDPKETWAFATWLSYLLYLHLRPSCKNQDFLFSWLIFSFILLQMCWWGINFLPSARDGSIHVY